MSDTVLKFDRQFIGKFNIQFDVLLVDQDIQFQNTPNFRANSFRIFLWKYIHPWLGYPKPEDSSYSANLTFHKVGLSKQHRVQKYVSVHKSLQTAASVCKDSFPLSRK